MNTSDFVTHEEIHEVHELQIALLMQIDQMDRRIRRLRWWTLTLAVLLLCLTIVVWRLA